VKTALLAGASLIAVAVFSIGLPSKETIRRLDLTVPVRQAILTAMDLLPESMQPTVDVSARSSDLQDEITCHEQAEKAHSKELEMQRRGTFDGNFNLTSHYNIKFNVCVALVKMNDTKSPSKLFLLGDVIGGHVLGAYAWDEQKRESKCTFEATPYSKSSDCKSEEEFDEAVRQYMTN
jgi:hypothetical protein